MEEHFVDRAEEFVDHFFSEMSDSDSPVLAEGFVAVLDNYLSHMVRYRKIGVDDYPVFMRVVVGILLCHIAGGWNTKSEGWRGVKLRTRTSEIPMLYRDEFETLVRAAERSEQLEYGNWE